MLYRLVFEDNENSLLAKLYRSYYPKEVSNSFLYLNGIGNIFYRLESYIRNYPNQLFVVFVDLPPINNALVELWNRDIRVLSKKYISNVIVIPIPCAEYLFLSSLSSSFFKRKDFRELVGEFPLGSMSLERYCKGIIRAGLYSCVSHDKTLNDGEFFGCYYRNDCPNVGKCLGLSSESLKSKSERFVMSYPVYYNPVSVFNLGTDILYKIHKDYITWYNSLVDIALRSGVKTHYAVSLY